MIRPKHAKTLTLATLALTLALPALLWSSGVEASSSDGNHDAILRKARRIAADLDTPEEAWAAGYRPDPECVPGMGVHWLHFGLFDTRLEPNRPEGLLFMPDSADLSDPAGDAFLGIEYLVVTEGTAHNSTRTSPVLMGQRLQGPMPGHFPGMPWHVDLHVYLIEGAESTEDFPPFHPAVTCPS